MMKRLLMLLTCFFLSMELALAQTSTVTGVVISDEDGGPVVGASVLVKGTGLGTITDMDGNFSIQGVPRSAKTLQISYVGMQTQEVAIRQGVIRVVLESDSELLDEVMVVAYGTAKKSAFTGSATVVHAEEIGKIQTSNALNTLEGKVTGMQLNTASGQPGITSPSINIRGITSINAGNSPLIILDGSPYDGDLNNLSTQDIESMTVLKDAASNALYGARGANGVIIITTKKGATGKAIVTVDTKWGSNSRGTRDYNYVKDPAQYYEMYYGALKSYFLSQGMDEATAHANANSGMLANSNNSDYGLSYNVYSVPEGQTLIGTNGKLNPNATLGNIVTYNGQEYMLRPDDWLDEAYHKGLRQEYNVSVSAGTEVSSFYASVNYLNNEGITDKSDYERLTGRLKADYQVKDWLRVGANMLYSHFDINALGDDGSSGSSGNIFAYATQIAPIYPLYIRDGQGNIMKDSNGLTMYDYGDRGNAGLPRPFLSGGNPYSANLLDTDNSEGNAMTVTGFAEISFLKDFKFTWTSDVNLDETRGTGYTNPYYGSYASSNGIASKTHSRSLSYNHQQLLNWRHAFGLHHAEVMLGHEAYRSKYYYLYASKSNSLDPSNTELDGAITDVGSSSYKSDYNTEGYFGRVQYDFDEKYFFSGSFRRDASSRFHPDNRWGNFWSAGGAWMISKEDFFRPDWVDMLKFKASYGQQGNDNIGSYLYVNTYSIVTSGGDVAVRPSATMGNKDITWETNGNFNTGFDFELFKGRISGTAEYFYRKTTDMLFSFPLTPSFGYTNYYANVGDMRNSGFELELNGTPFKTKDLVWNIRFNLSHYKNKITYLPEQRKTMEVDGVKGYSSGNYFYGEGIPLNTFRIRRYAGVDENGESLFYVKEKDADGNPTGNLTTTTKYDEADYFLCGTSLPDVYGGFGTNVSYKGLDFSIDFTYQIGGKTLDSDYAGMMSSPTATSKGSNFHADLLDSWTPENTGSNIPRFQFGDNYSTATSDRFLTSKSYLSIQNINLGYTLPSSVSQKIQIDKIRFYMSADNVFYWSKRQGFDPRTANAYYAPMRTISGGISLTF